MAHRRSVRAALIGVTALLVVSIVVAVVLLALEDGDEGTQTLRGQPVEARGPSPSPAPARATPADSRAT